MGYALRASPVQAERARMARGTNRIFVRLRQENGRFKNNLSTILRFHNSFIS